jgi:rod shape-determining protein MreC
MAYLALAIGLMAADHRGGYGQVLRQKLSWITAPAWWVASAPTRLFDASKEGLALRGQLQDDNAAMRRELEVASARLNRLSAVAEENQRLRELLGGTHGYRLSVQLSGILDVDLDPYRQRLVLDTGSDSGVHVGQALIDSGGVLGQVVEVSRRRATALLLTDPDHAVPVQVARTGLRAIAFGTGSTDKLSLPNIPQSAEVRVGDVLVTSGIGGRFPAGFPVGTISALHPDATGLFVVAEAKPAAHFDRGLEVLLISNLPAALDIGPPAPPHAQNAPPAATVPAADTAAPAAPVSTPPAARRADPPTTPTGVAR